MTKLSHSNHGPGAYAKTRGLHVFSDGPWGPMRISMQSELDIPYFVDGILSVGHRNVRVGPTQEIAIPYVIWKARGVLAGKA